MHEYIRELHYIVAIGNIPSILENGILCYELTSNIAHTSVALEEVQERRAKKKNPWGSASSQICEPLLKCQESNVISFDEKCLRGSLYSKD